MTKLSLKQKRKIVDRWKERNGAADFNLKSRDITLYDGGLFSIVSKRVKSCKIKGFKKLPNGNTEVLFSKNKSLNTVEHNAILWFEELDETINYLKRMKNMLNRIGYKTDVSIKKRK